MSKSKILLLSTAYLPYVGGSELAIKNITDRIDDIEFDLITAKLDKNSQNKERIGNIIVYRVGSFWGSLNILLPKVILPLAVFLKAVRLLKNNNYKLIHAYQASGAAGAGWLLKFFYPRLPFLITMQEGKDLRKQSFLIRFFRGLILKKANYATAISHYLKNYILSINKDIEVNIIPNGVDIVNFSKDYSYGDLASLDNKLGLKPDDKVIISVSRLVSKNGIDLLIEAMAMLTTKDLSHQGHGEESKGQKASYKLLITGEGPLEEDLKLKVKSLKLEDKIIFAGTISQKDLPLYLRISDVFARPSRSEGLGSAFLEAMAAGIPVIGTKVGGIPDFLEDRKTGLFCSLEPKDIAFKIRVILENDKLREEIAQNGKKMILDRYDWNKIAVEFKNLYFKIN